VESIDYALLLDDAMYGIVSRALQFVQAYGISGDYCIQIAFYTNKPGVRISSKLRKQHPLALTIILQYQFEGLEVRDESFEVTLAFNGVKEKLTIPFKAIFSFCDLNSEFSLNFKTTIEKPGTKKGQKIENKSSIDGKRSFPPCSEIYDKVIPLELYR